jgi:hypothetical protein
VNCGGTEGAAPGEEFEFAVWPVEYGEAWECELDTAMPFEPPVVGATGD